MNERILIVDDDEKLLKGYKRNLGDSLPIDFAIGSDEGLSFLNSGNTYAIVIADMRMPKMNGIEFLEQSKILSPESIRMMLTGNSDIETAMDAVNRGNVFRFLTKPCPAEKIKEALTDGLNEYRKNESERSAAKIDILTGLHNRRHLEDKIAEETNLQKRYSHIERKYSVIFIDLDNFKHYNDTYGHPVGDLLLKEFADVIRKVVRTTDFAARYGGDEFVLLLPETDVNGAKILAQRINEELAVKKQFQPEIEALLGTSITIDDTVRLSCSIGIAPLDKNSLADTITRADNAVLEAKRTGKNRFVIWEDKTASTQ